MSHGSKKRNVNNEQILGNQTSHFHKKLPMPRFPFLVVIIACLLALPGVLFTGFFFDDFIHLWALKGGTSITGLEKANLFEFIDGVPEHIVQAMNKGQLPWWSHPELKINFWRPLSTALHRLDFFLFGLNPLGPKVHSLLWYFGVIILLSRLYGRFLSSRMSGFALLIFSIASVHHEPVTWIAGRSALITAVLGVAALMMHIRWRQDNWVPGLLLSLGFYMAALLGSEAAIGMLAYFGAFELFIAKGTFRRKCACLLPVFALTLIYLGLYVSQGYGTHGSGAYLNPWEHPASYLFRLPLCLSFMLGVQFMGVPSYVLAAYHQNHEVLAGLSFVLFLVFSVLLYRVWKRADPNNRKIFLMFGIGALVSMLPPAAGMLNGRSLMVPSLGGSVLIAMALQVGWQEWKKRSRTTMKACLNLFVVLIVGLLHLVWSPLNWLMGTDIFINKIQIGIEKAIATAEITTSTQDQTVVFIQPPNGIVAIYLPVQMAVEGYPLPRRLFQLSMAKSSHRVHRTASDTIELEIVDGHMLETPFEIIFRPSDLPMKVGHQVQLEGMRARILETDKVGPTRIEFKFDRNLEDPSLRFVVWREGTIKSITLPDINESIFLPWEKGPGTP